MTAREALYGILAVLGVIGGWYFNLQYYAQAGTNFGWVDWMKQCFVNPAAASAFMDLTFGYIILAIWIVVEARKLDMRASWLYVLLTIWVSFAFGVGLFLLFRERHLRLRNMPSPLPA
jgi:tryptophan-rich sensory protein